MLQCHCLFLPSSDVVLSVLPMETKVREVFDSQTRWWSKETVAVVTGANKGIGLAIVRQLAELGLTVVLTSRDVLKGLGAVESLKDKGLNVHVFRLDVADAASIEAFVLWLRGAFGGLDILVNNAGVSFNEIDGNSVEHAETVIRTNFHGPRHLTHALLPLFRRSASVSRILNISSRLGLLNKVSNPALRETLKNEERLSEETIDGVVNQFLDHVKNGTWKEEGWPQVWTDYSVSKLALNAHSRLLAKQLKNQPISVNCFCPGFTKTAMTHGRGTHTAEAAAEIAARLVLLPPHKLPTGKFFIGCKPSSYSKL